MEKFTNIKNYLDFIPKCIICQKDLLIFLTYSFFHGPSGRWRDVNACCSISGDLLISNNKEYRPLAFNIYNNEVVIGKSLFKLLYPTIKINKYCSTCQFNCYSSIFFNKDFDFKGYEIKIGFSKTATAHLSVINNVWYINKYDKRSCILLNNNRVSDLGPDLSKISNLKQLKQKIDTILTFS